MHPLLLKTRENFEKDLKHPLFRVILRNSFPVGEAIGGIRVTPRSSGDTASPGQPVHIETKVWTNVISSPTDAEAWTVGGSKRKSRRNELESYASAAVRTRRFFMPGMPFRRKRSGRKPTRGEKMDEGSKRNVEPPGRGAFRCPHSSRRRSDSVPGSSPLPH